MESKCAGMENRNCLGFGILLVVVTLWDKSGEFEQCIIIVTISLRLYKDFCK